MVGGAVDAAGRAVGGALETLDNIDIERRVQSLPPLPRLPELPSLPNPFAVPEQSFLQENVTDDSLDKVDIDVDIDVEEVELPDQFCDQRSENITLEDIVEDIPNLSMFLQILETANNTEEFRYSSNP